AGSSWYFLRYMDPHCKDAGLGKDLRTALDRAYGRIEHIDFEGMQYRTDIGAKAFK
ncbi:phosphoribosylglycinamide synthetase C domain-containing protein, partial [Veillonella dispar]|uniref:phosphoribosylglycinamide synthetase C domain-containing protein n=1 Tax=Veillonella dispar TaxID=39778 RepID=UPI0034E96808